MSVTRSEVRAGAYYDSVVLMQLQRSLADLPGVEDAGVVMATPANCEILESSGLSVAHSAGSEDLLIVVKAQDSDSANEALENVDQLLASRRSRVAKAYRPRSLKSAVDQIPEAKWVLISVPGRYADSVAKEALTLGKNVFLFSDNVSVKNEVNLKRLARSNGLLLMGPDCGTAIIDGVGFGFANRVRKGPVGLVGASGTGMQAITSYIHELGGGISQAIGTGGRDLKNEIGAITTHQGLDLLAADSKTEVIVIVSKPPEPEVAATILNHASATGKPVVVDFIGKAPPARRMGNLHFAVSLKDAADLALTILKDGNIGSRRLQLPDSNARRSKGFIRGLFSGGTLAYEAMVALSTTLTRVYSNVPLHEWQHLGGLSVSREHTVLDLGEDEFTQGRLHPMMDNDLRLRRFDQEASDKDVGAIILDLVLGEGAHPDPASELAPAIEQAKRKASEEDRELTIAIIVIGTDSDNQNIDVQIQRLRTAGADIFRETPEAINFVTSKLELGMQYEPSSTDGDVFSSSVAAINVGLEVFYDSLESQGASVVQVDWRPPAGGDEKLMSLLSQLS